MPALVERRRDHGDVVQVAGAFPRIVGDVDIAFKHVLRADAADEVTNRLRHCIDVARRAGDGLRQHLSRHVIDAG
jgi:hypothetical protein